MVPLLQLCGCLSAVLLYVRFPEKEFKEYCIRKAESLFNGTKCTMEKSPMNSRSESV